MDKKYELRVDNFVRDKLKKNYIKFGEQHDLPKTIATGLNKASKSGDKFGKPDFAIVFDKFPDTCVLIEDKYGLNFLKDETKSGEVSMTGKSIESFALNGAVHYAKSLLNNPDTPFNYNNVYAIGVAGEGPEDDLDVKYECLLFKRGVEVIKKIDFKDFSYFNEKKFC